MIKLRAMTSEEFASWQTKAKADYAADQIRVGNWTEENGQQKAEEQFAGYLPQGLDTENHYLSLVLDATTEETVGHVWYAVMPGSTGPTLFIASLGIDEPYRRKGYAAAVLRTLDGEARALGTNSIRLHVFGDNTPARALYAKLGYEETNVQMVKQL